MYKTMILVVLFVSAQVAADTASATGSAACSACHGTNGVSVSDGIPNLAGQKTAYLEAQLRAFRAENRSNPLMNAIAGQLSDQDIAELAGFFSALPAGQDSATGDVTDTLSVRRIQFPVNFSSDYRFYTAENRPDTNQVRYLYANKAALAGAVSEQPLPGGSKIVMEVYKAKLDQDQKPVSGSDGVYVRDQLAGYAVMEKRDGWGADIPDVLRNDDWNYAFFTPEKSHRENLNQAECLACHKPKKDDYYLFSAKQLRAAAAGR